MTCYGWFYKGTVFLWLPWNGVWSWSLAVPSSNLLPFTPKSGFWYCHFYTLPILPLLFWHTWKRRSQIKNLNLIGAIHCCHVMYKLLYPSFRIRTVPPVSVRVRVTVSVSFSYGVTLLRILFLNLGPPFPGLLLFLPVALFTVSVLPWPFLPFTVQPPSSITRLTVTTWALLL